MTPHAKGMVGVMKSVETVSIVLETNKLKTQLPLVTCLGLLVTTRQSSFACENDQHCSCARFALNLFSISNRLKQGWLLGGNANALELISPDGKN